jgi:hypothetical protein
VNGGEAGAAGMNAEPGIGATVRRNGNTKFLTESFIFVECGALATLHFTYLYAVAIVK